MMARRWARLLIGALAVGLAMAGMGAIATAAEQAPPRPGRGISPLVAGGENARQPYSFMTRIVKDGVRICGGTLIAPTWVVTAAHCGGMEESEPLPVQVRIGSLMRESGGELIDIAEWIFDPGFVRGEIPTWVGNDIALLRLATPSTLAPAALGSGSKPGDAVRLMGWGLRCNDRDPEGNFTPECEPSEILKQLDTTLIDPIHCGPTGWINLEREVCVGAGSDGGHICGYDSGGPALNQKADGTWQLIGIVSHLAPGSSCGKTSAVVFTSVPVHRDWITKVTSGP
jgi:secreted trypsin-like serine protease